MGLFTKTLTPETLTVGGDANTWGDKIKDQLDAIYTDTVALEGLINAASETVVGMAEIATSAEVIAGTDNTRIVSPAGLAARTATDTRAGIVELATTAEATTGTDTARAVTAAGVKAVADARAPVGSVARAWVTFNGSGTILSGYNVSSINRTATGTFQITFSTPLADANYAISGMAQRVATNNGLVVSLDRLVTPSTTQFTVVTIETNAANLENPNRASVIVF